MMVLGTRRQELVIRMEAITDIGRQTNTGEKRRTTNRTKQALIN